MIIFQRLEDKFVPPIQVELMFDALRRNGLPVAGAMASEHKKEPRGRAILLLENFWL